MTTIELKAGDRVAFSRAWLRSTGHVAGEVPFMRGRVRTVEHHLVRRDDTVGGPADPHAVVTVAWDGGSDSRVLACNLVRVDRLHLQPV